MSRAMKDSGIEWIGLIPQSCEMSRVGYHFICILGQMVNDKSMTDSDTLENYLSAINVHFDGIDFSIIKKMWFSDNAKKIFKVNENDLLIVEGGAGAGGACIFNTPDLEDYYIQNSIHRVYPININEFENKYLWYAIYSLVKQGYINYISNLATIPHFTKDKLKHTPIVFRKISEQKNIISYLDKKCADIDKMISLQAEMIEELKAYKQSVITEAVTKGLDPTVPMKDSGIEWIREIPESWRIIKIKFIAVIKNEKATEILPYIGLENIESFSSKYIITDSQYDVSQAIKICRGDVLFGKLRPYLAKVYIVIEDNCCSSEFMVFSPSCNSNLLRYVLLSHWFINIVDSSTYGAKMPRANPDYIKNMQIVLPTNNNEQQAIADYLDKKCADIDSLISIKQLKIDELKDYKKSLIYEYVTGKKEVI